MKVSDFRFELPDALIARAPAAQRTGSRLLCLEGSGGAICHRQFSDLTQLLQPGDLLVFNDTRVIPARLYARKQTGGAAQMLVERILEPLRVLAHVRASKSPRPGTRLQLLAEGDKVHCDVLVVARHDDLFELEFPQPGALAIMEAIGHIPLPPYIDRPDDAVDRSRYQTVYAQHQGAVAAPTAGLHFDQAMLDRLDAMGVERTFVTLHVGAGTFQNIRVENVRDHRMHSERIVVSEASAMAINRAHAEGRRVVAVGTTSLRTLESMADGQEIRAGEQETDLFIYPGYRFRAVDALVTNFHLSESTLLMLVCAFAGTEAVLAAYREAVDQRYRFFSYGDAMFLTAAHPPLLKQIGS